MNSLRGLCAGDFPLWKKGTKGDLQTLSTLQREKSPSIPLFQRGKWDTEITYQTSIVIFNKLLLIGCNSQRQI